MPSKDPFSSFINLEVDAEGNSTFKFFKELDKRTSQAKRMISYGMANDILGSVKASLTGGKYKDVSNNLAVSEGPDNWFAVTIKNKARNIKKTDIDTTLIYIKAKRLQDRTKPEIKILQDYSPWTVDTIPFWPSTQQAIITQRKVDKKTVEKISSAKKSAKNKINRQLTQLGQKGVNDAMAKRTRDSKKVKAVPDIAFQILTLEFGGGSQRGMHMWRNALKDLFPGKLKNIAQRYKKINAALGDSRSSSWRNWPRVDDKIKSTELKSFIKFQKQLGF